MSKLTPEEAAKWLLGMVLHWEDIPDPFVNRETKMEALRCGATALRFQDRHRWRRLSEEKPSNKFGYYQVFPVRIEGVDETNTDVWFPDEGEGGEWANDPEGRITHWAYLLDPPEEEAE